MHSFGVVLVEVYDRKDPYDGEDFIEVINLIKDGRMNKRPGIPKAMPETVQSIMMDCLRENPNSRPTFRTLDQLFQELNSASIEPAVVQETNMYQMGRNAPSLQNSLPKHIADALQDGQRPEPERHDMVTILVAEGRFPRTKVFVLLITTN